MQSSPNVQAASVPVDPTSIENCRSGAASKLAFIELIETIDQLYTTVLPAQEREQLDREIKMKGPGVEQHWQWQYK
jgi:hypothetical protein